MEFSSTTNDARPASLRGRASRDDARRRSRRGFTLLELMLVDALSGGPPPSWCGRGLVPGRAAGRLTGGNLALVAHLIGTPYFPDIAGGILVLEDETFAAATH